MIESVCQRSTVERGFVRIDVLLRLHVGARISGQPAGGAESLAARGASRQAQKAPPQMREAQRLLSPSPMQTHCPPLLFDARTRKFRSVEEAALLAPLRQERRFSRHLHVSVYARIARQGQ